HPLLQIAAERRLPADAQHLAARAQAVAEIALLGTPVALYDAVIGRAVQENIVHVPLVLPLGDFVGKVEVVPNAREIDADGRLRIAEQVAAAVGGIFAAILEIHRERGLAGIDESADVGRLLVSLVLRRAARLPEIAQQKVRRV